MQRGVRRGDSTYTCVVTVRMFEYQKLTLFNTSLVWHIQGCWHAVHAFTWATIQNVNISYTFFSSHHSGCDPSWCNDVLLMHVMTCLNTRNTKILNKSVTWGEATWGTQHLCIRKEIISTNQTILVSQMIPRNIFSRMGAAWRSQSNLSIQNPYADPPRRLWLHLWATVSHVSTMTRNLKYLSRYDFIHVRI